MGWRAAGSLAWMTLSPPEKTRRQSVAALPRTPDGESNPHCARRAPARPDPFTALCNRTIAQDRLVMPVVGPGLQSFMSRGGAGKAWSAVTARACKSGRSALP